MSTDRHVIQPYIWNRGQYDQQPGIKVIYDRGCLIIPISVARDTADLIHDYLDQHENGDNA